MACFPCYKVVISTLTLILLVSPSSSSSKTRLNARLNVNFYAQSCPDLLEIVREGVYDAIQKEARMGASLLRLHFHDCFVNGCDGSVLLDDTPTLKGEKSAAPNMNSLRGFEVIDAIKESVESTCPKTVSCADILAIAAMFSVYQLGGYFWQVEVGRIDAVTASQAQANVSLPSPTSDLNVLITKFSDVGLNKQDLAVLSGAHTIGVAKCKNFRARLYNETNIDGDLAKKLKDKCSRTVGEGDDDLEPMDRYTPDFFDNDYYGALANEEGLLHSDQQLFKDGGDESIRSIVMTYTEHETAFKLDFAASMIKMGRISPSAGKKGQIRTNCRRPN